MSIVFRLLGIEGILEKFVGNIEKIGWWRASEEYIADLEIKVESRLSDFPKNGGVLVYANHPTGLDPFLISSILRRDDVYFLSDIYHANKGKSVQQHMIPVYYSGWRDLRERSGLAFLGFIWMRLMNGFVTGSIAKEKNNKALSIAVQKLREGHVVLVFPSGGNSEKKPWKRGLGEMILKMKDEKFVLYQCRIAGLTEFGLLWHFLGMRNYFLKSKVEIDGKKMAKSFFTSGSDSVYVTRYLQSDFFGVG